MKLNNQKKIINELYYQTYRIRSVETYIAENYSKGEMRCPTHLSIGQEAVSAALSQIMRKKDFAVSSHRAHAHYMAKGGSLKKNDCRNLRQSYWLLQRKRWFHAFN